MSSPFLPPLADNEPLGFALANMNKEEFTTEQLTVYLRETLRLDASSLERVEISRSQDRTTLKLHVALSNQQLSQFAHDLRIAEWRRTVPREVSKSDLSFIDKDTNHSPVEWGREDVDLPPDNLSHAEREQHQRIPSADDEGAHIPASEVDYALSHFDIIDTRFTTYGTRRDIVDNLVGNRTRKPIDDSTLGYCTRKPIDDSTVGDHTRNPIQDSTIGDHIRNPVQDSTVGDCTRKPIDDSTVGDRTRKPIDDSQVNGHHRREIDDSQDNFRQVTSKSPLTDAKCLRCHSESHVDTQCPRNVKTRFPRVRVAPRDRCFTCNQYHKTVDCRYNKPYETGGSGGAGLVSGSGGGGGGYFS